MNKLFTKIGTAIVGLAMAVGVGVAVGRDGFIETKAVDVTNEETAFTSNSLPNGWTGSSLTAASGYQAVGSGGYVEVSISTFLGGNERALSSSLVVTPSMGRYGTE